MSGGTDFDMGLMDVMARLTVADQVLMTGEDLRWRLFHADMYAFRVLGHSITGATYLKGKRAPHVREVSDRWFDDIARLMHPKWMRAVATAFAWRIVIGALR